MSQPLDDSNRTFLDPLPDEVRKPPRAESDRADSPRAESSSGCRTFAIGCGCLLLVMVMIAAGLGIWAAFRWKHWAADFSMSVATEAIKRSSLPPEDKARVTKRLNGLAEDFKSGKLAPQQAWQIIEQIGKSPLLAVGMVTAADEHYVKPSGLTDDEKTTACRTLQRFARGAFEKKISEADLKEVLEMITDKQPSGQGQLKQKLTDAELNALLDKAKQKADAAGIPDEPFEVNIADELERAIDRVVNPSAEQ